MQQPNYKTEMFDKHPNLRAKLWCAGSDCEFRLALLLKKCGYEGQERFVFPDTVSRLIDWAKTLELATPRSGERVLNAYWKFIYEESETCTAGLKP